MDRYVVRFCIIKPAVLGLEFWEKRMGLESFTLSLLLLQSREKRILRRTLLQYHH